MKGERLIGISNFENECGKQAIAEKTNNTDRPTKVVSAVINDYGVFSGLTRSHDLTKKAHSTVNHCSSIIQADV